MLHIGTKYNVYSIAFMAICQAAPSIEKSLLQKIFYLYRNTRLGFGTKRVFFLFFILSKFTHNVETNFT
jgi:hypothetical protein